MSVTINENGDVMVDASALFKCRTERIVIENSNADDKLIQLQESLRTVTSDGVMGLTPLVQMGHVFRPQDMADFEWGGIGFAQVFGWIQAWATAQNVADAPTLVGMLLPPADPPA